MKTEAKENKLYPRVTLDCRISCTHPFFRGDGYTAQVFVQLVTMQSYKAEKKRLNDKFNWVNLERTQVLTSISTLMGLTGFTKHRVTKAIEKLIRLQLISEEKCENIPGQHKNDGTVYTILRLAGSPRVPDTSAETKSDGINTNTNKRKKFTPPTYNEVLAYAEEKDWPDAKNLADKFFEYYDGTGWIKEKVNKPVRNWKLTMCDWQDRQGNQQSIKVVKSSQTLTGQEALLQYDMAESA